MGIERRGSAIMKGEERVTLRKGGGNERVATGEKERKRSEETVARGRRQHRAAIDTNRFSEKQIS